MAKKLMSIKFTEEEKSEYLKMILQALYEGKSYTEIAEHIGISATTVQRFKDKLIQNGEITQEQIKEARQMRKQDQKENNQDRQKILEGLREGKNIRQIANGVSVKECRVSQIIRELIKEGKITQEEIDETRKRLDTSEEEKEIVYEFLMKKISMKEISRITGYNYEKVREIKRTLAREGKIDSGKYIPEIIPKDSGDDIDEDLKQSIIELYLQGYTSLIICKKLNISSLVEFNRIREVLLKEGKITKEQIATARKEKAKQDEETVYRLLLKGYTQGDITREVEDMSIDKINRIRVKLEAEGRITKEDIERYKFENNEKKILEYVLRMLKQGYSHGEIAENDPNGYLTHSNIWRYKKKLVEEGLITDEEIEKAKEKVKRRKAKKRKMESKEPFDERMVKLFKFGFTQEQIARILELNVGYVYKRREILILQKKLTKAEIKTARKFREDEADERRKRIQGPGEEKSKIKDVNTHIEYCKAQLKLGELYPKDIVLIIQAVQYTPELMTNSNINFVITAFTRNQEPIRAIKFLNICLNILDKDDTERRERLLRAKQEVELYMKRLEAQKLLNLKYYSIEDIAKTTGLRVGEVLKLQKSNNSSKGEAENQEEQR